MDLIVLIVAAMLIVAAGAMVVVHTKPRPHGALEYLWIIAPAVGVVALLILAFARVVE